VITLAALALLAAQELSTGAKDPAPGQILVATDKSHDPDLAHSVIVLVHCDRDGAIGLIVNHPNGKAFEGGPLALGVRTLVRSKVKAENAEHIAGDLYLFDSLVNLPGARVFAGYTGWSAQQLKDEISRGLWKILASDPSVVFDPSPSTLWRRLAR
jgi:putative transcriptional regulator